MTTNRPLRPYTCIGRRPDGPAVRIGIVAPSLSEAIDTARELFPTYYICKSSLEPEWEDPA